MPSSRPPRSQDPSRSSSTTSSKPKRSSRPPASSRPSSRFPKTEIVINVYDLLPSGAVSSCLWPLGLSLLHTGIVLGNKEYSYGATSSLEDGSRSGGPQTGIFWTHPQLEPPGATFRCSLLIGFTYLTQQELEGLVNEASGQFLGSEYNIMTNNCNHFTNHMCRALTKREAPGWINRASKVGILLPCLVPRDWVNPPDADAAEDAWLEGNEDDDAQEGSSMLRSFRVENAGADHSGDSQYSSVGKSRRQDNEGRNLPASEAAPTTTLI